MTLKISVHIPNPTLADAVYRAGAALGFHLVLRPEPDHESGAVENILFLPSIDSDRPLRLGTVFDWISLHANKAQQGADLPSILLFSSGELDLKRSLFSPRAGGDVIRLTDREIDILTALYRALDRTLSRPDLLSDVWGYAATTETHTIETHIYRLRQKIEADPSTPQVLRTVEGGYQLRCVD